MPTKTKQTAPPNRTVATEPRIAENGPEQATPPAGTAPRSLAEEWPLFFEADDMTRTHELIIEAVTEMITVGGHHEEVDALIGAAMAHGRRRFFGPLIDSKTELKKTIAEFNPDAFNEWKTDLMITWRKNSLSDQPHVEPKSVTDRIRANFRGVVEGSFENFMRGASPEEVRLLWGVLNNWESRNQLPEHRHDEIYLGNAFEFELGRNRCYIRVPERMVDQVEKYIDALRAVDDKAVV